MTRYYLYRQQNGEGCDYTIGCAESLTPLSSKLAGDAIAEAKELLTRPDEELALVEGGLRDCMVVELLADMMDVVRFTVRQKTKATGAARLGLLERELARIQAEYEEAKKNS